MDLSRAHYDARNGTLFTFDALNRRVAPGKVQYVNPSPYAIDAGLNVRVGGLIPDINFQMAFIRAFYSAFDEVQRQYGNPLQFDDNWLTDHKGADFINGDMTFFVERSDKPDNADYRAEFRATLAVNQYNGIVNSLVEYIRKELATLAVKA